MAAASSASSVTVTPSHPRLSIASIDALQAKVSAIETTAAVCEEKKLAMTAEAGGYDVKSHLEFGSSSDLDYLSIKEKEIIRDLKAKIEGDSKIDNELKSRITNRFLAVFLIARKWNIDRTIELIQGYWKVRCDHNLKAPINIADISSLPPIADPYTHAPVGLFDQLGRPISYIIMRNFFPKKHTFAEQLKYMMFILENTIAGWPLAKWRRGVVYVEDLKGVGFSNLGGDSDKTMKLLENALPIRINKIIILNPNWMFRFLIAIARLFMKKSVMERMHLIKAEELSYYIGGNRGVLKEWGGELELTKENDLAAQPLNALNDLNVDAF